MTKLKVLIKAILPNKLFLFLFFHYYLSKWYFGRNLNMLHPKEKIEIIKKLQRRYKYAIFVETGTNYGITLYGVKNLFKKLYSIECNNKVFEEAKRRFKYINIDLLKGNSPAILRELMRYINDPCFFWLDAHADYEEKIAPPIIKELEAIKESRVKSHIILIDDARLFNGKNNWPFKELLFKKLREINNNYKIKIEKDIIVAYL